MILLCVVSVRLSCVGADCCAVEGTMSSPGTLPFLKIPLTVFDVAIAARESVLDGGGAVDVDEWDVAVVIVGARGSSNTTDVRFPMPMLKSNWSWKIKHTQINSIQFNIFLDPKCIYNKYLVILDDCITFVAGNPVK